MSEKELVVSVTAKDLEVQTFRAGGKGGQHQNKTDSGVRIIHAASGARGESREHRSQLQNKKAALKRLTETAEFKYWVHVQTGKYESEEAYLKRQLAPGKVRTEVRVDGKWQLAE